MRTEIKLATTTINPIQLARVSDVQYHAPIDVDQEVSAGVECNTMSTLKLLHADIPHEVIPAMMEALLYDTAKFRTQIDVQNEDHSVSDLGSFWLTSDSLMKFHLSRKEPSTGLNPARFSLSPLRDVARIVLAYYSQHRQQASRQCLGNATMSRCSQLKWSIAMMK